MLDRLLRFLAGADAPTEGDSDRDGVFSYAAEYHAFLIGLATGAVASVGGQPMLALAVLGVAVGGSGAEWAIKQLKGRGVVTEISREPWYSIGGVVVGYALPFLAEYAPAM